MFCECFCLLDILTIVSVYYLYFLVICFFPFTLELFLHFVMIIICCNYLMQHLIMCELICRYNKWARFVIRQASIPSVVLCHCPALLFNVFTSSLILYIFSLLLFHVFTCSLILCIFSLPIPLLLHMCMCKCVCYPFPLPCHLFVYPFILII